MKTKKLIVYGGSFNPPSFAHITLAKQLIHGIEADMLLFLPVGDHYKKNGLISANHRVNMLKLACNDSKNLQVSLIEIQAEKRLYTIETLDMIREIYKNYEIFFVMGMDNLRDICNWKEYERLFREYKIIVMNRASDTLNKVFKDIPHLKCYKDNIIQIVGLLQTDISSTLIRKYISENKPIKHLTTKEISKYIKDNKLYK